MDEPLGRDGGRTAIDHRSKGRCGRKESRREKRKLRPAAAYPRSSEKHLCGAMTLTFSTCSSLHETLSGSPGADVRGARRERRSSERDSARATEDRRGGHEGLEIIQG